MRSQKRGILIIVNNIHFINKPWLRRNGAETDRDNLVHVFRQMGFFVCVQEDLTKLVGKIAFHRLFLEFIHQLVYAIILLTIRSDRAGIFGSSKEYRAVQRHSVVRLLYVCGAQPWRTKRSGICGRRSNRCGGDFNQI